MFGYDAIQWLSSKDVIYQQREEGKEMVTSDLKKCLLKDLNIIRSKDVVLDNHAIFENKWNSFIADLRADIHSRNSWYMF